MSYRTLRRLGGSALAWALLTGCALAQDAMRLSSPAFAPGQPIPAKYARAHGNVSPPLKIENVPPGTKSLALIVDDPDAPSGLWTHWLLWNVTPDTMSISEGAPPPGAKQGKNSDHEVKYDGPSPPKGTHHYIFHLYALDTVLNVPQGASRRTLWAAMQGHIKATAETEGTYAAGS